MQTKQTILARPLFKAYAKTLKVFEPASVTVFLKLEDLLAAGAQVVSASATKVVVTRQGREAHVLSSGTVEWKELTLVKKVVQTLAPKKPSTVKENSKMKSPQKRFQKNK